VSGGQVSDLSYDLRTTDRLAWEDLPMCRWFVITALLGAALPTVARAEPLPDFGHREVRSEEELNATATWHRYILEEVAKRVAVNKAAYEVQAAMQVVRLHEVRAPIDGVVTKISRFSGEGVKAHSDVILQIKAQ
jgi:hypothetical protein